MKPCPRALLLMAALIAGGALAAPAHHHAHHEAAPKPVVWVNFQDHPAGYFSDADRPDAKAFLPPPPAPDSPRGKGDLATYAIMKDLEGKPRWLEARADADVETPAAPKAFTCAAGMEISPTATPVTSLLLARVMMDIAKADDHAKDDYARKRPFLADNGDTCVEKADWLVKQGSYPSGHSATGWAWGLVLSELEPDRQAALVKRGFSYGQSRVVCRVHFASDVEVGRLVGAVVVARLHANAAFLADMKRAKVELARARISKPAIGCSADTVASGER